MCRPSYCQVPLFKEGRRPPKAAAAESAVSTEVAWVLRSAASVAMEGRLSSYNVRCRTRESSNQVRAAPVVMDRARAAQEKTAPMAGTGWPGAAQAANRGQRQPVLPGDGWERPALEATQAR